MLGTETLKQRVLEKHPFIVRAARGDLTRNLEIILYDYTLKKAT